MAKIISIFFSSPSEPVNCCRILEDSLGIPFHSETENGLTRYAARCLGLELVWFDNHGLVNDLEIPFEDYEYELDIILLATRINATITEAHQRSASRYIFHLFADVLHWKSALVDNLQQLVAISPPTISQALD